MCLPAKLSSYQAISINLQQIFSLSALVYSPSLQLARGIMVTVQDSHLLITNLQPLTCKLAQSDRPPYIVHPLCKAVASLVQSRLADFLAHFSVYVTMQCHQCMQCKLPLYYIISVFVCAMPVLYLCPDLGQCDHATAVIGTQLGLQTLFDFYWGLYIVPYTLFNPTPSLNYYTSGAYKCASIIELKPVKTARIQQQLS